MAANIKDVLAELEHLSRDSSLSAARRQAVKVMLETHQVLTQAVSVATGQQAALKREQHRAALFEQALRDIIAVKATDPERQAFEMRRFADKALKSST